MRGFDVRRLAAIDMYGRSGSPVRRWLVLLEFVGAAVICALLGAVTVVHGGPLLLAFGCWLIGVAANYLALALHALALRRPGALATELDGVASSEQLRFYTLAQLWIVVPLAVAVLAVRQLRGRPARSHTR